MKVGLILAVLLAARVSAAQDQPDELAQIRAQLAAQQEQIRQLEAELHQPKEEEPVIAARRLGLTLLAFIQADGVIYNQASSDQLTDSTGDPLNQTRFLIRRAHVGTTLSRGILAGTLELEASTVTDPLVRVFESSFTVRWPGQQPVVAGTLGLYRVPFGYENVEKDYDRLFLERSSIIRALFPGENDLGAGIWGAWRVFRYALSAMNGDPIGEKLFPYRDPNESKDILGRAGIETRLSRRATLRAGFSGLMGTGFHKGTPATKDTLVWRDSNEDGIVQLSELQIIPGQPATASQNFDRFAVGGDAGVTVTLPRLGDLLVYGEFVWASNLDRSLEPADPVAAGYDLREVGWYIGFTQELGRHALVGVRYDEYNPDADSQERQGLNVVPTNRTYTTLAIAVALRLGGSHRLTLEYDHNTNALGRTMGGLPTTLGADVLTARGQVVF